MAKKIIFDSGPIISLTTNNLLFILDELKKKQEIDFFITPAVYKELVERPLSSKKYKFEAMQVIDCINRGVLKIFEDPRLKDETMDILSLANNLYFAQDTFVTIVHYAEIETVAAYRIMGADAIVVDERTTRILAEDPNRLQQIMENKLHTKVNLETEKLEKFKKRLGDISIVRSVELVAVAFEKGVLDRFIPKILNLKDSENELLESVLWAVKLNGCAVSEEEIDTIIKIESERKKQ